MKVESRNCIFDMVESWYLEMELHRNCSTGEGIVQDIEREIKQKIKIHFFQ